MQYGNASTAEIAGVMLAAQCIIELPAMQASRCPVRLQSPTSAMKLSAKK
jgi:hypothetical protein